MNRQVCVTNLKAQNEAQGKTVRLNSALSKPDVDDIQALLGKIYYLKHPSIWWIIFPKCKYFAFLVGFPSKSGFSLDLDWTLC